MIANATTASIRPETLLAAVSVEKVRFADHDARRRLTAMLTASSSEPPDGWVMVKHNVPRTVWRHDGPEGVLYLKHFHNVSPWHRLRRRLGRSGAIREMRFSELLSPRGVATPKVLAACCSGGIEWVITEGVAGAVQADEWHAERRAAGDHRAIRATTVALARLVGRMHALGVIHHDLHCGNVLVLPDDPGRVVLMDLHRMARHRRLSRHARAANLAQLFGDRRLWTTRSQRLRFLSHYLRAAEAEGTRLGWMGLIEPLARRHIRRLATKREKRIFRTNRYFARLSVAGARTHVVLASKRRVPGSRAAELTFTADQWLRALAEPEALFTGDVEIVKDSPSSLVVRRRLRVGDAELDVYVKRPRRRHRRRWIADMFRLSRALRAFHMGHALLARHIHTALPLAAMERRMGPLLLDSILITEAADGGADAPEAMHLNRFLNRHLGPSRKGDPLPAEQRGHLARQVLWQLGRLLRRLHEEGFAHRDLKGSNLLIRWDGSPDTPPAIILVDLDGARRVRRVTARQEFRGLMRLNVSLLECPPVSHAGRLRMLIGYLRRPGMASVPFKPHWRQLQEWSSKKIRRQITSRQRRQKAQRRAGAVTARPPESVLLIKPSSLGDVITGIPVLRGLRRSFPRAHLAWLVTPACAGVLEGQAELDEVIEFDRRRFGRMGWDPLAGRDFIRFCRDIRRRRFDWVIDLQGLFRSGFIARVSGAPVRAGFARARELATMFYTRAVEVRADHTIDRNIELAQALGVDARPEDLALTPTDAARQAIAERLAESGAPAGGYVLLIPGTRWPSKLYPVRHWRSLIAELRGDAAIVLGGAPDERALCDELAEPFGDAVANLAGQTSLAQFVALVASAGAVVCCDSAANFIAPAVATPSVTLIGPTRPERTGPYGPRTRALLGDVTCQGCLKRRCRHVTCMQTIDPRQVAQAVREARLCENRNIGATTPVP